MLSKNQKRIVWLFFTVALAVVFYVLLTKPNNKPSIINNTGQPQTSKSQTPTPQPNVANNKSAATPTMTVDQDLGEQNKPSSAAKTYHQLYRDFRLAEQCAQVFNALDEGLSVQDTTQNLLDGLEKRMSEFSKSPTPSQTMVHEDHISTCTQLADQYGHAAPIIEPANKYRRPNHIAEYLASLLLTEAATTKQEQNLKILRLLIQPWNENWANLMVLAKKPTNESAPNVQALIAEIEQLRADMNHQRQLLGSAFTAEMVMQHIAGLRKRQAQLSQLYEFNHSDKRSQLKAINLQAEQIETFMQLKDPDLFYEASALLNDERKIKSLNGKSVSTHFKGELLSRLGINYLNMTGRLMQKTGQLYRLNMLSVSPYANHLLLCALGQNCGPGSPIMNMYCLGIDHHRIYPSACEQDLYDFYFGQYLSPNQQQDVLNMFDQLVTLYGS